MRRCKKIFWLVSLLIWQVALPAQWRGPVLEKFGPDEGFTGDVRDFAQDSLGYIYIASSQGLYQYDGNTFRLHVHDPDDPHSISPGHVFQVIGGRDGLVWMTIYKSGVNSFDPQTNLFTRYALPDHGLTGLTGGISLVEDDQGHLWIGSHHYRLHRLDPAQGTFETFLPPWIDPATLLDNRKDITHIMIDKSDPNLLWLTVLDVTGPGAPRTRDGIFSFNRATHEFAWTNCCGSLEHQDDLGRLWSFTWGSSYTIYDPASKECKLHDFAGFVLDDEPGFGPLTLDIKMYNEELLLCNFAGILSVQGDSNLSWKIKSGPGVEYSEMLADRAQNLWLGFREGLHVMSPKNQHIRFFDLNKYSAAGRLYPATLAYDPLEDAVYLPEVYDYYESYELYQIPLGREKAGQDKAFTIPFKVRGIARDDEDRLWATGDGGLFLIDAQTGDLNRVNYLCKKGEQIPWLWSLQQHPSGWLVGAGGSEIIWFDPDSLALRRLHKDEIVKDGYRAGFGGCSFGPDQSIFAFLGNRLLQLDLRTGRPRLPKFPDAMAQQMGLIQDVRFTGADTLWVLTLSSLYQWQYRADTLKLRDRYTVKDGIISPTMNELQVDNSGRIWIFSNGGINCLDPSTRDIRYYGPKEGLPTAWMDPRQVLVLPDGRMATVSSSGLIVFDPDALWSSTSNPTTKVIVQEVRINGNTYSGNTRSGGAADYWLPRGPRIVDVRFQALTYPTDRQVNYSYRIGHEDERWIEIGKNNFVTLPELPFGKTTVEIKAGNAISTAPVNRLNFVVPTPIYAYWWSLPVFALFIALLLFLVYRWRVNQIRKRAEEKMELELSALRSQMNPHFMFNSLNSVKAYIVQAKPEVAADYLSQFAHLIRRILQNSREKLITLQEEIDTLELYINLEQFRVNHAFDYIQEITQNVDARAVLIPPMLLQPFIENAIWHGLMHKKENGKLRLSFVREEDQIVCTIHDNGIGRHRSQEMQNISAKKHKSLGMGITQNRVDLMNRLNAYGITIEVIDLKDLTGDALGTKVVIRLPASIREEELI